MRAKRHLYASSVALMLATAPWWFATDTAPVWLGLPLWALYSLAMTLLYAGSLAYWLGRHWELSSQAPEGDADRPGGGEAP